MKRTKNVQGIIGVPYDTPNCRQVILHTRNAILIDSQHPEQETETDPTDTVYD